MRARPSRWKAERHSTSSRAVFTRRLTGRATQPTEWMCALAADLTLSSNIFERTSSMSCTSLSRRSCWAGESDCSRGLTRALWDTNAFSSLRRRKPPMLYSGAKGKMTPNSRLVGVSETARLWGALAGILMEVSVYAATPFTLPSEDRILPSSLELERKTEPWCPGDCAVGVPFVARYRKGRASG